MPLDDQITAFAWTLAIGFLAGFCHEFYRAAKDMLGLKKFGTFAGDLLFWIFLTAVSFILLIRANYGQIRLYVFIGLLLGAFLFVHFLGKHAYRLVQALFYLAGKTLRITAMFFLLIWKALCFPFKLVFIILAYPLNIAGGLMGRAGRFAGRRARRPAGWVRIRFNHLTSRLFKKSPPPPGL